MSMMKTDAELLDRAVLDGWYSTTLEGSGDPPFERWNNLRGDGELQWVTRGEWMSPALRRVLRMRYDRYSLRNETLGL